MDLDWLVFDQLCKFLLGQGLVEVLPEPLVVSGQVVDLLVLPLLLLLQLRNESLQFVGLLLVSSLEFVNEVAGVLGSCCACNLLLQLRDLCLLLFPHHLTLLLQERDCVAEAICGTFRHSL